MDKKSHYLPVYQCIIPPTNVLPGIRIKWGDSTTMPPPLMANDNQLMRSGGRATMVGQEGE
jgi:hypothetical protein